MASANNKKNSDGYKRNKLLSAMDKPGENITMLSKELKKLAENYSPKAVIATPIKDKAVIQNLQAEGVSVFDEHAMKDKFHQKNRDEIKKDLIEVYNSIVL